jgi:transcription initiation factor TFIIIB Brf1 subunit/transcription initiation factor TFIIB
MNNELKKKKEWIREKIEDRRLENWLDNYKNLHKGNKNPDVFHETAQSIYNEMNRNGTDGGKSKHLTMSEMTANDEGGHAMPKMKLP